MHDDDIHIPFPPARYRSVDAERVRQAGPRTQPAAYTPAPDPRLEPVAVATYPLESDQLAARRLAPVKPRPRIGLVTCALLWLAFCSAIGGAAYLFSR